MFPFDEIPVSQIRTSLDIEKFGKQSLLRALNIGRVVAFIGSGTSTNFGQPHWEEFRSRSAKLFFALENSIRLNPELWDNTEENPPPFMREFRTKLTPLAREIKELHAEKSIDASHFVGLCEKYFAETEQLLEKYSVSARNHSDWGTLAIGYAEIGDDWRPRIPTKKVARHHVVKWAAAQYGPPILNGDEIVRSPLTLDDFRQMFADRFSSVRRKKSNVHEAKLRWPRKIRHQRKALNAATPSPALNASTLVKAFDKDSKDVALVDGPRALHAHLGIRRFLTLNYDLELELMLLEEGRTAPKGSRERFLNFIKQSSTNNDSENPDLGRGRAVTLSSASGRVLRSTSSRPETLADLFSFGAYPTNYDASVHHLHGRIDDPSNMIVTPGDYQKIYYGKSDQKKSFDEARHAVFTGSDILVVGMGHKESDVLEPLRDFMELEADRRDAYGKVYYLTSSKLGGEDHFKTAFSNTRSRNMALSQQLFQNYGMHTLFIDHTFETEPEGQWPIDVATLFFARCEVHHIYKSIEGGRKPVDWEGDQIKRFSKVFGKQKPHEGDKEALKKLTKKLSPLEVKLAREIAEKARTGPTSITDNAKAAYLNMLSTIESRLTSRGLVKYIETLSESRNKWWDKWQKRPGLRYAVLGPHHYRLKNHKSLSLEESTAELAFPGDKSGTASTFRLTKPKERDKGIPIVWRQTNLVAEFGKKPFELGNRDKRPQFTSFMEITGHARKQAIAASITWNKDRRKRQKDGLKTYPNCAPTKFPAAIARISMPPGSGKGRLVAFFTSLQSIAGTGEEKVYPFQYLFDEEFRPRTEEEYDPNTAVRTSEARGVQYIGCFMAHLSFTLEISSLIVSLGRLLQNLAPELRKVSDSPDNPENKSKWDEFCNLQFQKRYDREPGLKILSDFMEFLKEVCPRGGWPKRVVVMLSYLDRLVDENGDAHSPIHRAFFRTISGWYDPEGHLRLPIDFIFINCHADRPIRYLSNERRISGNENRRAAKWQDSRWKIRKDRYCALEYWTEVENAGEIAVFHEALFASAELTPNNKSKLSSSQRVKQILAWLSAGTAERSNHFGLPPSLGAFLQRRLVYGYFIAGLANEIWLTTLHKENSKHREKFQEKWNKYVVGLSAALTRDRSMGFFEELLSIYRQIDRLNGRKQKNTRNSAFTRNLESRESQVKEQLRAVLVDHLALFSYPVSSSAIVACPEIDEMLMGLSAADRDDFIPNELNRLVARGLCARYHKFSRLSVDLSASKQLNGDDKNSVYALDTKLITALRTRANLSIYRHYRLVPFQTSIYPSQPEQSIKPDISHYLRVRRIVRALVKDSHHFLVEHYDKECLRDEKGDVKETHYILDDKVLFRESFEEISEKLRAAFALIRGTFSVSVVSRLGEDFSENAKRASFDEYRTWTRKLLNTATLMTWFRDRYRQKHANDEDALAINHPFFRSEVSWLYNERALVSFVQGRLFDALPLFEQSLKVLGTSYSPTNPRSYKSTHRRVLLNMALAQLERGNIKIAQDTFQDITDETQKQWQGETPSILNCYARGYIALCRHLTDNFTGAAEGYLSVIEELQHLGDARGQSIFRRHYADLLRIMSKSRDDDDYREAINQLRSAEELALGVRATDLQNYALIAQARLNRDMHKRREALENLRQAEEFARKMSIQKMRTEVLKVRGEVLLAEGEATQAGFVTAQSIAMAKRNGMRLRKISAAIIQARILIIRSQRMDAIRLLRETVTESQTLGYATKTSSATRLLEDLL